MGFPLKKDGEYSREYSRNIPENTLGNILRGYSREYSQEYSRQYSWEYSRNVLGNIKSTLGSTLGSTHSQGFPFPGIPIPTFELGHDDALMGCLGACYMHARNLVSAVVTNLL